MPGNEDTQWSSCSCSYSHGCPDAAVVDLKGIRSAYATRVFFCACAVCLNVRAVYAPQIAEDMEVVKKSHLDIRGWGELPDHNTRNRTLTRRWELLINQFLVCFLTEVFFYFKLLFSMSVFPDNSFFQHILFFLQVRSQNTIIYQTTSPVM